MKYAREISPYKRMLVFFITSKLLGVLNAPLMSCHGGIRDLRASQMKCDIWRGILSRTNSIPITSCPDRSKPGVLHELKADLGNSETALREEWRSHIVGKRWRLCQKAVKEIWLRRLRGRLVHVRQKHGDICALIYSQQILWGQRAT